jgi:hypothetical protein
MGLKQRTERLGMIMHRLERILGPAEHASKPGHDLLSLEPLTPRRILGTTDVLDHAEIAQRRTPPEPPCLSVMVLASIAVQPRPCRKGDRPGLTVQAGEAFRERFPAAS